MQRVEGIDFAYRPPPRHLVPFAAALLSTRKSPAVPGQSISSSSSTCGSALFSIGSDGMTSSSSSSSSDFVSPGKVAQWLKTSAPEGSDLHHQNMSGSPYAPPGGSDVHGPIMMPMTGHQYRLHHQQEPPSQTAVIDMLQNLTSNISQPGSSHWRSPEGLSTCSSAELAPPPTPPPPPPPRPPPPPPRTAAQRQCNFSIKSDATPSPSSLHQDLRHHHLHQQQLLQMALSPPEPSLPAWATAIPGNPTPGHPKMRSTVPGHQYPTMMSSKQQRCPSSTQRWTQQAPPPPPSPWTPSPAASTGISGHHQRLDQRRQKQGLPTYLSIQHDPRHQQETADEDGMH